MAIRDSAKNFVDENPSNAEDQVTIGDIEVDLLTPQLKEMMRLLNQIEKNVLLMSKIHLKALKQSSSPESQLTELKSLCESISTFSIRANSVGEKLTELMTVEVSKRADYRIRKVQTVAILKRFQVMKEDYYNKQEIFLTRYREKISRKKKTNYENKTFLEIQKIVEKQDSNPSSKECIAQRVQSQKSMNDGEKNKKQTSVQEDDNQVKMPIIRNEALLPKLEELSMDGVSLRTVKVEPFLVEVEELKGSIGQIEQEVVLLRKIHLEILNNTSSNFKRTELDTLRKSIFTKSTLVNSGVARMRRLVMSGEGQATEQRIYKAQTAALVVRFHAAIESYYKEQETFLVRFQEKIFRMLKIIDTDSKFISNLSPKNLMTYNIESHPLNNVIEQWRCDMIGLEKDKELRDIFQDMSLLIDEQNFVVDNIEANLGLGMPHVS